MGVRVLVVTNLYPPHAFGGYEDLCAGAVRCWRREGHTVEVLTSSWRRPGVPVDASPPAGEPVVRTLPIQWDGHRMVRPGMVTAARFEHRTRREVSEAVARVRPDVASIWNAGALSLGILTYLAEAEVPAVLVVGDRWLEWGRAADRWADACGRGVMAPVVRGLGSALGLATELRSDHVVATFASEHLRAGARERSPFELRRTALVPHGVDLERYPLRERPPGRPWSGRLLYVGRLAPEKGVDTAVRAAVRLSDVTLDVIGTGDDGYVRRLRALATSAGQRVRFVGEAGPERLRRAYAEADALVFPSTWQEPFGIVPLEAMALGTPVIATGTGGSGEYLRDRSTALRFPPGDDAALADAIRTLASDDGLRRRLAETGPAVARWLDRRRTYEDLLAWDRHAAGGSGEPPADRPLLPPELAS